MTFQEHADLINEQEVKNRIERDKLYEQYISQGRIWGAVPRERIRQIRFTKVPNEKINIIRTYADTPTISDILDKIGIRGEIPASFIPPVSRGRKIVGQAMTLKNLPDRKETLRGYLDKEFIGMSTKDIGFLADAGNVLVIDSCGLTDVSSFGGMAANTYASRGIEGAIVWGAVRDIPAIVECGFPVWSKGQTCKTGKYRISAVEINGPVAIAGVMVCPGDVIVADDSGICVIPVEYIDEIISQIEDIYNSERRMASLIESRKSIDEIRAADRPQYK